MLVLSRRKHEEIVLPGLGITIKVLNVRGKTALIGIDAPVEIKILRQEATIASTAFVDQITKRDVTFSS